MALAAVMAVQVTQAAPPGLVETALAASVGTTKAAVAGISATRPRAHLPRRLFTNRAMVQV